MVSRSLSRGGDSDTREASMQLPNPDSTRVTRRLPPVFQVEEPSGLNEDQVATAHLVAGVPMDIVGSGVAKG